MVTMMMVMIRMMMMMISIIMNNLCEEQSMLHDSGIIMSLCLRISKTNHFEKNDIDEMHS